MRSALRGNVIKVVSFQKFILPILLGLESDTSHIVWKGVFCNFEMLQASTNCTINILQNELFHFFISKPAKIALDIFGQ